jgi:hypothetical protein
VIPDSLKYQWTDSRYAVELIERSERPAGGPFRYYAQGERWAYAGKPRQLLWWCPVDVDPFPRSKGPRQVRGDLCQGIAVRPSRVVSSIQHSAGGRSIM